MISCRDFLWTWDVKLTSAACSVLFRILSRVFLFRFFFFEKHPPSDIRWRRRSHLTLSRCGWECGMNVWHVVAPSSNFRARRAFCAEHRIYWSMEHAPGSKRGVLGQIRQWRMPKWSRHTVVGAGQEIDWGRASKTRVGGLPAHDCTYVPPAIAGQDCRRAREPRYQKKKNEGNPKKKMATSRRYRLQATYVCTRNNMCDVCPAVWKPLAPISSLCTPLPLFLGFRSLDLQAHPYVSSYIQCGVNKLFVPPRTKSKTYFLGPSSLLFFLASKHFVLLLELRIKGAVCGGGIAGIAGIAGSATLASYRAMAHHLDDGLAYQ